MPSEHRKTALRAVSALSDLINEDGLYGDDLRTLDRALSICMKEAQRHG